jgi:hypothetical protein
VKTVGCRAWEISQDEPQRMFGAQLIIAIRQDKQCCCALNTPAKKFDQVERRFICPMNIFKDEDRWTSLKLNKLE